MYNGWAIANVPAKNVIIPRITINNDATFAIVSCPKIMPIKPINININDIKYNWNAMRKDNASIL